MRDAWREPRVFRALLGISLFWFLGACYLTQLPAWTRAFMERLEPEAKARETLVMGLRRRAGWSRAEFRAATGFDYDALRGAEIARLAQAGLLVVKPDAIRLAEEALFISDTVFAELV